MSDRQDESKRRLALELLQSLRSDRGGRAGSNDADRIQQARKGAKADDADIIAAGFNKRDNKRFNYPALRVVVGKDTYSSLDWSIGGISIGSFFGDLKKNMRITLTFAHDTPGSNYFGATARVIRHDEKKHTVSFKFETLSRGGFEFLSALQLQQTKAARKGA